MDSHEDLRAEIERLKRSTVSAERIEEFVNELLADPDVNLSMVPDAIERSIQRRVLLALFKTIAKVVDGVSVDLLGHTLKLRIEPKSEGPA